MQAAIESLGSQLQDMNTASDKIETFMAGPFSEPMHTVAPRAIANQTEELPSPFSAILQKHQLTDLFPDWYFTNLLLDGYTLFNELPCANVEPQINKSCPNSGKMACGACMLVSYCSKECQRLHWKTHKQDCKDPIRSPSWQPSWVTEMRQPSFISNEKHNNDWRSSSSIEDRELAFGIPIWSTIPATDSLNLPNNEAKFGSVNDRDFSLAYVATGDLRNVVRTVNELPDDYSGQLTLLINDLQPYIVARNLLLLYLLGTTQYPVDAAAEFALHLWYSAYLRPGQDINVTYAIMQLCQVVVEKDRSFSVQFGPQSTMSGLMSMEIGPVLTDMAGSTLELHAISKEIHRVRFAPSREDRHHRHYCYLEPSHRLASLEFRRFGLVLPFGAANNLFGIPNRTLFSRRGRWLGSDMADPLDSWNIEDVIATGKSHGASRADLYGCLYFYLLEQLRRFATRLRTFRVNILAFNVDARDLAKDIRSGTLANYGLPKNISFDRIEVSNILDTEYVGLAGVLADWGPLLKKENPHATLFGLSMNWVPKQPGSQPEVDELVSLAKALREEDKYPAGISPLAICYLSKYYTPLYDNSKAFARYLKKQNVEDACRKSGVKLKERNTIVPHRIGAMPNEPASALPDYPTKESWYLKVGVTGALLSERFVEFSRV